MEITRENLKGLIQKNFDAQLSEQEGTWAPGMQQREDLDDLLHFYRNSFARGIIEFGEAPRKTTPMRPYPFNQRGFHPRWFVVEYLYSKLTAKRRKRMYRRDFDILHAAGIKFPAFNPEHADLYYDFDGSAFNFEMRKFGADIALMRPFTGHVKNICEIGAGYGGMCEMLTVNQPFDRYLIIDLFETLSVSMTYLLHSPTFEGFRFFYIESADDVKNMPARSIAFVSYKTFHNISESHVQPADLSTSSLAARSLKALPIELFINISSFVEMGPTIVGEYFDFIQSYDDVYLFSANNMNRHEQGEAFGAYDFPYDKNWEHLCDVPHSHLPSELSRLSYRKAS